MSNLQQQATKIRRKVLDMIYKAGTSHIGSNFSCVDILTILFDIADFKKDKLIVSKGWVAATVYALAAEHGLIPEEDLDTFCQEGSKYIGLIEPLDFFGCEFAGGSMGYGLPAGVGYALAKKMKGEEGKVYVLMSDGELAIGTTWESALIAAHHKLDNLIVVIDRNDFQAMGKTDDVLKLSPLADKWVDFGWSISFMNGHSLDGFSHEIKAASQVVYDNSSYYGAFRPRIILCETTKGKGVSFMENDNIWHYSKIDDEHYKKALAELEVCQTSQ